MIVAIDPVARSGFPRLPSVYLIRVIRGLQVFCIFPRNEPPNPAEYVGERPEMTPAVGSQERLKR
jgi:hypothetical protein